MTVVCRNEDHWIVFLSVFSYGERGVVFLCDEGGVYIVSIDTIQRSSLIF